MSTIKTEGVWMPQSTFDELDIYVKRLEKVVAAARNFDYELKPDEYRRGTSVWIDGDEMKELNLALEELDRAERGGG